MTRDKERERERARLNRQKQKEALKAAAYVRDPPAYVHDPPAYVHKTPIPPKPEDEEADMEEVALKYSPSFKEEDVDMNTVQFTMNARDGREFFKKEMSEFVDKIGKRLPGLANRGWRWLNVEVTLKVKPK